MSGFVRHRNVFIYLGFARSIHCGAATDNVAVSGDEWDPRWSTQNSKQGVHPVWSKVLWHVNGYIVDASRGEMLLPNHFVPVM